MDLKKNIHWDLPEVFRQVRFKEGMTLAEFAPLLGITRSMLGKIEKGTRLPSGKVVKRLTDYVGLSISDLMGGQLFA